MNKHHPIPKNTTLIIIAITLATTICGCSISKVITQPGPADLNGIGEGTNRQEVISRLGPPNAIDTDRNGHKQDMFALAVSNSKCNTWLVTSLRRHLSQLQHFVIDLKRGSKPMDFSRPIVELPGNRVQLVLRVA